MAWISGLAFGLGPLPDARQEGILHQFYSYKDVALFHFRIPRQVTRATWEFAGFQDDPHCPSRTAQVWIQHGSYPVFNVTDVNDVYPVRTQLAHFTVDSEFRPANSKVFHVYNPLPGSWFVSAYIDPYEEAVGIGHKCRYSLGSVALWSRTEDVDLILPNRGPQIFKSKSRFSYLKFYVPDDVDNFELTVDNCVVNLSHRRPNLNNDTACIEYVSYRGHALPVHSPDVANDAGQSFRNLGARDRAQFLERRPYTSQYYYVLIVSKGQVSYNVTVTFRGCGQSGLYGPGQRDWYLSERGLILASNKTHPLTKEPQSGFQLFARRSQQPAATDLDDFNLISDADGGSGGGGSGDNATCISTFDFTKISDVDAFTAGYVLQGKSWYTEWVTVVEKSPVFTRFEVQEYLDVGGHLSIRIGFDDVPAWDGKSAEMPEHRNQTYQLVYGCLSRGRQPRVTQNGTMICDDRESTLRMLNAPNATKVTKVLPYPEPGRWYLGFQIACFRLRPDGGKTYLPCPVREMTSTMISINMMLEGCPGQTDKRQCHEHGLCASVYKGHHRLSACLCSEGRSGWFCDRAEDDKRRALVVGTVLLTLSNLAFAPAVALAVRHRLFAEGLVYFAAMSFSTLYHVCDEVTGAFAEAPAALQDMCVPLFMEREVLQFCDFYAATLSMWVTLVALLRNPELTPLLDVFGALLVAVLVQNNRTGLEVFVVPVTLGLFLLLTAFLVRTKRRGRLYRPSRKFVTHIGLALAFSSVAGCLMAFAATTRNYAYVHSVWHVLLAVSLAFLVPKCALTPREKPTTTSRKSESESSKDATVSVQLSSNCVSPT